MSLLGHHFSFWEQGRKIKKGVNTLIKKHDLGNVLSINGKDCWSFLIFEDTDIYSQWELKTLFLQEVFARGVLTLGTHNISYAHSDEDITRLLNAYNEVFMLLKETIEKNVMDKWLKTEPLVPLFKIR